jgi:hypothetical protein
MFVPRNRRTVRALRPVTRPIITRPGAFVRRQKSQDVLSDGRGDPDGTVRAIDRGSARCDEPLEVSRR